MAGLIGFFVVLRGSSFAAHALPLGTFPGAAAGVGALLVFSLMVRPAFAARRLTSRPFPAMMLSAALSLAILWAAIALSFLSDWPIGFFVGSLSALAYAAGRAWSAARQPAARSGRRT